ncbi:hypothetical protein ACMAY4_02980 [Porticoccaceae bacterium nBUS_17]
MTHESSRNPEVVFVTHAFPPAGGSGVQRIAKFARYLPESGIQASVITAKNISKTTADSSLLEGLECLEIVRSLSLDPMFIADRFKSRSAKTVLGAEKPSVIHRGKSILFLMLLKIRDYCRLPDQYIGWIPFAFFSGVKHIKAKKTPVIIASLPTYTNGLLGYFLSKATGAPLILDFRDSWTDDPYLSLPTKFHRWVHTKLENRILGHAKHLVVYGDWLKDIYDRRYPSIPTTVILNGYDACDFPDKVVSDGESRKIRLAYSGSLFEYHHEFVELLFATISLLPSDSRNQLELVFAGDIQLTSFDALVDKYGLSSSVVKLGYVKHSDALSLLLSADGLLFTIPKGDTSSFTGKIFEYLGARKPIISFVCAHGLGGKLLSEFGHSTWLIDYDAARAKEVFSGLITSITEEMPYDAELYAKIERKGQAAALARIVKGLA